APNSDRVRGRKLLKGVIEPIGKDATLTLIAENGERLYSAALPVANHGEAASQFLSRWPSLGLPAEVPGLKDIHLFAFRVVHGADLFREPSRIDGKLLAQIDGLDDLAPLHNANCVAVIRASLPVLRDTVPGIAVFDSAFHHTLPEKAF